MLPSIAGQPEEEPIMFYRLLLSVACVAAASQCRAGDSTDDAQATPKPASSRIASVTVYQNNALVTREVEVPGGIGTMELVVTPLPPQTLNNSLYSEGGDGIRVLTTRYRMRAIKEDTREEVRKLEHQNTELGLAAQRMQNSVKAIEQNLQLLAKLETFTAATTQHATEKAVLSSESVIALTKYVMNTRNEKNKELVDLQQQLQSNAEQSEFAKRQLHELTAGANKTERDAVIIVDKKNPAAGKIRLNYLVDSAFWRPQYKLRAGTKSPEPVHLEYLAAIVQQSGEDWSNVNLTLSTAQPMYNAAPPDLKTLELTVIPRAGAPTQIALDSINGTKSSTNTSEIAQQARSLRGKGQQEFNYKNDMSGSTFYNSAAALEQGCDLLAPREELLSAGRGRNPTPAWEEGPSVTYHLRTTFSVPSRPDEQVLEVAKLDLTPDFYYKAVPVLTKHVYRLANLTNRSESILLPGEATMYVGTDFVGRANLPLVAIGEQFTAGFGVDPQLQVERHLVDKSRTTQGGNQVVKYEYRMRINSYKSEPVKLQVWDRLPRTENETVSVNLIKTTPEISTDSLYVREQKPQNLLRWDLSVEPGTNGEKAATIRYEFKLELDRQMLISGVVSK
jgi:hypothetical protein